MTRETILALIVLAGGILLLDHLVSDLAARVYTLEQQAIERAAQ